MFGLELSWAAYLLLLPGTDHEHQSAAKQNMSGNFFLTNLHTQLKSLLLQILHTSLPRAADKALNSPSLSLCACTLLWIVSMSSTQISFPFVEGKDREVDFCHPSRRNLESTYPTWASRVNQQHPSVHHGGWMEGWCVDRKQFFIIFLFHS